MGWDGCRGEASTALNEFAALLVEDTGLAVCLFVPCEGLELHIPSFIPTYIFIENIINLWEYLNLTKLSNFDFSKMLWSSRKSKCCRRMSGSRRPCRELLCKWAYPDSRHTPSRNTHLVLKVTCTCMLIAVLFVIIRNYYYGRMGK